MSIECAFLTAGVRDVPAVLVDLAAAFEFRCWARARLFAEGELTLHEFVDQLQADTIGTGLVAALGQDAVQEVMSAAFGRVRTKPTAWDIGVDAVDFRVDEPPAARSKTPHIAASTIEAMRYVARQNDEQRLRRWLLRFTTEERVALRGHMVVPDA